MCRGTKGHGEKNGKKPSGTTPVHRRRRQAGSRTDHGAAGKQLSPRPANAGIGHPVQG